MLAARLRRETRAAHAAAERSGIMRSILRGRAERAAYCGLLRALYEIYEALEPALVRHSGSPAVAGVRFPELRRAAALAADLDVLHGPGWRRELPPCGAAVAYAARVRRLAAETPERLVAHAYVRYMGDLSGGQILRGLVARTLGAPPAGGGGGVSFYDFGGPEAVAALKAELRGELSALPAGGAVADAIVDEAKLAFAQHVLLFEELDDAAAA